MRKTRIRKVFYILLLAPLVHMAIILIQYLNFSRIKNLPYQELKIASLKRPGKLPLDVYGVIGNVFQPNAYNRNLDIDLVPVSCTVDPISFGFNNTVFWSYNDLLRSALENTIATNDRKALDQLVNEMILKMSSNKKYIQYFINVSPSLYDPKNYDLVKINQPFIWDIPQGGQFHKTSKIDQIAAIPIFYPKAAARKLSFKEIHERLEDNLDISIRRFFYDIRDQKLSDIRTLGIPALAASSNRNDSEYYLDYAKSFLQIVKSVDLYAPEQIDRIFLFVHDELKIRNPDEFKGAIKGLFIFRHTTWIKNEGARVMVYLTFVLFALGYLLYYPKIKDIFLNRNTKINRRNFISNLGGLLSLVIGILLLTKPVLIWLSEASIYLVIFGEIILAIATYRFLLWISKISLTDEEKLHEINEKTVKAIINKK